MTPALWGGGEALIAGINLPSLSYEITGYVALKKADYSRGG
jgi:hypothetical protein